MKQTVANDNAVVFECELPEPRDKVWRALTQRELLAAWLMPNDIRPEVGAKFQLQPLTEGAAPDEHAAVASENAVIPATRAPVERAATPRAPVECEVLAADPGRTLRWRQREPADAVSSRYFIESVVSFELADTPAGGTLLRVVHDGFTTVAHCSTVVAFRPRAKVAVTPTAAIKPTAAITPTAAAIPTAAITPNTAITAMSCTLRRAA